jgi:chemotaxis protein methyltransferase CheR
MTVIDRISAQARLRLGMAARPHKDYFWEARLSKLVLREGFSSREAFADLLEAGEGRAVDALERHLTTNHTYFFREARHFSVLPGLLRENGVTRPRVWSAAGSTGEEGYSLAITLAEAGFQDFLVLVSDVNRGVLAEASRGVYAEAKAARVPEPLRRKYFERVGGGWRVRPSLRAHVRFRRLNLMEPLEVDQPLDAVFCRNLLIYFDADGIRDVLGKLVGSLKPGGVLVLGESEGFHHPVGTVPVAGASVCRKEGR